MESNKEIETLKRLDLADFINFPAEWHNMMPHITFLETLLIARLRKLGGYSTTRDMIMQSVQLRSTLGKFIGKLVNDFDYPELELKEQIDLVIMWTIDSVIHTIEASQMFKGLLECEPDMIHIAMDKAKASTMELSNAIKRVLTNKRIINGLDVFVPNVEKFDRIYRSRTSGKEAFTCLIGFLAITLTQSWNYFTDLEPSIEPSLEPSIKLSLEPSHDFELKQYLVRMVMSQLLLSRSSGYEISQALISAIKIGCEIYY